MLFQELGKLKRTTIMFSIIMMTVGIVMILCPHSYTGALIDVLGYVALIAATVMILNFIGGRRSAGDYISLTISLIIGIVGLSILVFNDETNTILYTLSVIFGSFLIIDGIHSLLNAFIYGRRAGRKGWWVLVVLAGLLMMYGSIIIIKFNRNQANVVVASHELLTTFGWLLVFSSIVGIVRLILVWPIKKEEV